MVPRAQPQPQQAADDVGDNVVEVKVAVVEQEALQKPGAPAQDQRAYHKRHVDRPAAVRVDDPVEDDGEEEEGEEVQQLVVDEVAELELRKSSIRR